VNRLQIIAVLGVATLAACSASDEPADRPRVDAGRDTRTTVVRVDGQSPDRLDASGGGHADEASTRPDPDVAVPDGPSPPPDAAVPPPDGSPPLPDGSSPPPADAAPPPMDVTPDVAVASCVVSFTVHGVAWSNPEGGASDAQVPGRIVRLVGDPANLGSWTPTSGVPLTETSPGIWSGTAILRDQQLTEFKFVKMEGTTPEWENWLPYDSNRSLRVECHGDAGTLRDAIEVDATTAGDSAGDRTTHGDGATSDVVSDQSAGDGSVDAAADAATIDGAVSDATADAIDWGAPSDARVVPVPARGRAYVGMFGVRPPDATK
jgi:hypothetical protein